MEAHLFEPVPLVTIARQAAASPRHFHRTFTAVTGETPGVSPGRFRKQKGILPAAYLYPPLDPAALVARPGRIDVMEPRIVRLPAFVVVGMAGRFTMATTTQIPALWARFAPRIDEVPHRRGAHTLGLCLDPDAPTGDEGSFTYMAAVEVERAAGLPAGMTSHTVPANTYAVFTHTGHVSRLPDTVRQVWGRWLPASPYRHVSAPDFEYYGERWNPATGEGPVDIYVPIADD